MGWPRLQLFEWEDFPQCPRILRDITTDYLRFTCDVMQLYRPIVPLIVDSLRRSNTNSVIDLCSGGGGPWRFLQRQLVNHGISKLSVRLTDKYPNADAIRNLNTSGDLAIDLRYHTESVDATAVSGNLIGFRTMFGAFHHFPPEVGQAVLADAVRSSQGIGIFEISERTISAIIMELLGALLVPISTFFSRPFSLKRVLLSTVIPIAPLMVMWDAVVSCLRSYTEEEFRQMIRGIPAHEKFDWQIGKRRVPWLIMRVTYIIGHPKSA